MLKRATVMTRSDYTEPIGMQCQTYGLSQWIPLTGYGSTSVEAYNFRSGLGNFTTVSFDWYNNPSIWESTKRMLMATLARAGGILILIAIVLCASALSYGAVRSEVAPAVMSLDGGGWRLATDPGNVGREKGWASKPVPEAKPTKAPWIIQDIFPDYHGVAWYWREFKAPVNPHQRGRYIIRFWAVDYKADVWVNGKFIGGHEGGETPFSLDATRAIKPNSTISPQ